jgi:tRNA-2-methylthio-N6-dimethylallyladenosine synthase
MAKGTKIYLETYGCQMNEYDSLLIESILGAHNYDLVASPAEADWVLFNTCAVRENAQERIYSRIKHMEQHAPAARLGVLGCMAQNLQDRLLQHPKVGLVAGPDSYRNLPGALAHPHESHLFTRLDKDELYSGIFAPADARVSAFITIMRGCDNACTFCVVPFTRGRERSRSPEEILAEAQGLTAEGTREITLLGQNVNSYAHQGNGPFYDFAALLDLLSRESGARRIRFTSPHPKDFPEALLDLMAERDNLMPQIHLPLQSGSDRILSLMKRGYSRDEFLALVEQIRAKLPRVFLSTDAIFGFPTETEDEAQQTLSCMAEADFTFAYIFKYSPREHTYAQRHYPDDVPEEEKSRRVTQGVNEQQQRSLEHHQHLVGAELEVLIERESKKSPNQWMGRSREGYSVILDKGRLSLGDVAQVTIAQATSATLLAQSSGRFSAKPAKMAPKTSSREGASGQG